MSTTYNTYNYKKSAKRTYKRYCKYGNECRDLKCRYHHPHPDNEHINWKLCLYGDRCYAHMKNTCIYRHVPYKRTYYDKDLVPITNKDTRINRFKYTYKELDVIDNENWWNSLSPELKKIVNNPDDIEMPPNKKIKLDTNVNDTVYIKLSNSEMTQDVKNFIDSL